MGSNPHELNMHCRPTFIPRSITDFLVEISTMCNGSEKICRIDEYLGRLEDEMRKIDAFRRELPLSMLLLNDAVMALKEELNLCKKRNAELVPVEFIPLKKIDDEDKKAEFTREKDSTDKMNWMASVQLWNSDDFGSKTDLSNSTHSKKAEIKKRNEEERGNLPITNDSLQPPKIKNLGKAYDPTKDHGLTIKTAKNGEKEELPRFSIRVPEIGSSYFNMKPLGRSECSSSTNCKMNTPQPTQQQTTRKQRRCWSPELHRRFLNALQQLGGSQAATPKQIRELMQVDGLTNDEVKSHLQKYRLHSRKLPASQTNHSIVALGGFHPHQDQYCESENPSMSQSGSPEGPLQLCGASRGTSMTGGNSLENEEDQRSESPSWRGHSNTSGSK